MAVKGQARTWGDLGTGARGRGERLARRRFYGLAQQRLEAAELEGRALVEQRAQRLLQLRAVVAQQPPRDPGVRAPEDLVVPVCAQRYALPHKRTPTGLSPAAFSALIEVTLGGYQRSLPATNRNEQPQFWVQTSRNMSPEVVSGLKKEGREGGARWEAHLKD